MAVPRASVIQAHCPKPSRGRLPTTGLSSPPCSRATATSRAAFTPRCGPTTSPRRHWSSPTPWPAGTIRKDSPAGKYLMAHGVEPKDFNSYGSRRGNHEVMMRGTFANIRLKNLLIPLREDGSRVEGGYTRHLPDGPVVSIYDA